jgi:hypothetical protein
MGWFAMPATTSSKSSSNMANTDSAVGSSWA